MRLLASTLLLLAAPAACGLLPDRVYTEVANNPWDPRLTDTDEYVVSFGVEYDLSPQEVVIAGQQERHPWDASAALGLHQGDAADAGPVPLVVKDDANEKVLATLLETTQLLQKSIVEGNKISAQKAADMRAMKLAFDRAEAAWDAANKTLLGGGGLVTLISLLVGRRLHEAAKAAKEKDDE